MSQSPLLRSLKTIQGSEPGFGRISVVEAFKDTSFEIRRVYFTCEVKAGCIRGGHAHKTLTQLLICPFGAIEIVLLLTNNMFVKVKNLGLPKFKSLV